MQSYKACTEQNKLGEKNHRSQKTNYTRNLIYTHTHARARAHTHTHTRIHTRKKERKKETNKQTNEHRGKEHSYITEDFCIKKPRLLVTSTGSLYHLAEACFSLFIVFYLY